jgi:lipoyl(octanoyl) transferase
MSETDPSPADPTSTESAENTVLLHVEPEAHPGSRNMATDEYLLEAALENNLKAVRMYRWEQATISLGYFQDSNDEALTSTFQNLQAVRRLSGGGAILHDRELTYSFVLPANDPLTREPTALYTRVHTAIIDVLRNFGVDCVMRGEDGAESDEPFLCFVRGDRHDIHCSGHKVVGSAQRRRKGAVLQHGSILLEHSPHAPQIPGICDLTDALRSDASSSNRFDELEAQLGAAIAKTLGPVQQIDEWPLDAATRIAELERDRYRSLRWNREKGR